MNNNQQSKSGAAIGIGAGVVAAAVAAAGAYWLYGSKHSAQHRKIAKSWMLKARAEVLDTVEKLQDLDKAKYLSIAQNVVNRYATQANATSAEVGSMMRDFKSAWMHMQSAKNDAVRGSKTAKRTTNRVKRVMKKPATRSRSTSRSKR